MSDKKIYEGNNFPAFNPNDFEIKTQIYDDTGGGCMVGSVEFYLPSADTSVWINCTNESVNVYSVDTIWNKDDSNTWGKEDDYLLFRADFEDGIPSDTKPWFEMIKEALDFTIEKETAYFDSSYAFSIPVAWLPDSIKEGIMPDYLDWLQKHNENIHISKGGLIDIHDKYVPSDRDTFDDHDLPKPEKYANEFISTFRHAKYLPDGWGWQEWDDGSGSLVSPEGQRLVGYDITTNEYQMDGKWSFMGEDGLDREYFEKLVYAKYVQPNQETSKKSTINRSDDVAGDFLVWQHENQKAKQESDFMSKYDISARVNPLKDQSKNVKAMASVNIDGVIAINDLTIVEGKNGLFVGYPQTKDKDGNFRDIVEFMRDEDGKMTTASVDLKNAIGKILTDMYKKNERETPMKEGQEKSPVMHEVKAFVTPLRDSKNSTKGLATVQVGDMFKVNSIRINESSKDGANFVAMPSRPDKATESGYRDVIHPVNKEFGETLKSAVLKQYDNQLAWKNRTATADKVQDAPQQTRQATNKSTHDIE